MGENDDNDLPVQEDSSEIGDRRSVVEDGKRPVELSANVFESEIRSIVAQSGPRYHPVFDKFEPEHVTQFLNNTYERDVAIRRQLGTDRNYALVYFFTFIGFIIFLAVMLLPENKEIFFDIIKILGSLIAGGLGGYGLHAYRSGRRDKEP